MKQALYAVFLIIALFLSGCGTNSAIDPVQPINDDETVEVGGYEFTNITNELNITEFKNYTINVQLSKDGMVVPNKLISIKAFDDKFGNIENMNQLTDRNGKVSFTYVPPVNIPDKNSELTVIFHDGNITLTHSVPLIFNESYNTTKSLSFTGVINNLEVNNPNELHTINVYVANGEHVGVENATVSITSIENVKYGAILSASTVKTDASGKASFLYRSPQDIGAIDGETTKITLILKNANETIDTEDINITFHKQNDVNISMPMVVINTKSIDLTNNSQTLTIPVKVFEENTITPYTTGKVKVKLPNKVIDGVDVGYFNEYEVEVGSNGIAEFIYTGPQNLKELIEKGDLNSTFEFYHLENSTQRASVTVLYKPANDYVPSNYILTSVSDDDKYTMGLEKIKSFTIYLKDDKGNLIDDSQINKITITAENTPVGKLINPDTTEKLGVLVYEGDEQATNKKSFTIDTDTISGLLPININVSFTDANGDNQTISTKMNITVFSGPPTALSISYVGVEHNATIGKFIEKFAVSAVDAYNNPINTRPYISTGAMVEYAVDGSSFTGERTTHSPRLWHGRLDSKAKIVAIGGNKAQLETPYDSFKYVDFDNDKLVVFGKSYVYEALGKWDIKPNSDNILDLVDDYTGITRDGLYYAVGHNNRQDLCSNDAREYVGKMMSDTYQLDDTGNVLIEFAYDYHLTGKDIMVWVNLTGYQADTNEMTRIGEAQKHTLRGMGLVSLQQYKLPGFAKNVECYFEIQHKNIPEHYRNGHFAWRYKGCQVDGILDYSNFYDARDCINTTAFIDLNVSNPSPKDCIIELVDIETSPEFKSSTAY